MVFNFNVIAKAEGYEGSKRFEVMAEGDKTIGNCDWACFIKFVIEEAFFSCLVLPLSSLCMSLVVTIPSCLFSKALLRIVFSCWRAGRCESKNPGGGKKMHSVLEVDPSRPMCISSPSRLK